ACYSWSGHGFKIELRTRNSLPLLQCQQGLIKFVQSQTSRVISCQNSKGEWISSACWEAWKAFKNICTYLLCTLRSPTSNATIA
ncbi:unnamed protein product, partial [Pocillopora meandrina]